MIGHDIATGAAPVSGYQTIAAGQGRVISTRA